jgi:hypothetical protein
MRLKIMEGRFECSEGSESTIGFNTRQSKVYVTSTSRACTSNMIPYDSRDFVQKNSFQINLRQP